MANVEVACCATVDLTNSDNEGACEPRHREGSDSGRKGAQRGGKKQPNPVEVVDLTSDTPSPPGRRAGRSAGKIVLDFEEGEGQASMMGAGGRARGIFSKRTKVQDNDSGSSRSTVAGGASVSKARADGSDPDLSVSCPVCSKDMKTRSRIFLSCEHWACSDCLSKLALGDGRCHSCKARICLEDMAQFLDQEQVLQTSESVVQNLLASNNNFVRCPNPICGNVFERMVSSVECADGLPKHAPDGQPLTECQAKHMQQNRFRCDACASNFCASCKALPYHTAATCQQAEAARCAVKCRFCQTQLPTGKKDSSTCGSEECERRMAAACEVKLSCGHRCMGTFGERVCAPCLECADQADEFCNICWTEELRAAPCLRLRCGHYFHSHCTKERLQKQWPTPKISFTYAKCPLCNVWVDHPEVEGTMRKVHALRNKVESAAMERYRIEGLGAEAPSPGKAPSRGARGSPGANSLLAGDRVEVHSLQAKPEYNGKCGTLVAFKAESGRWEVDLDGGGSLHVKAANLSKHAGAAASAGDSGKGAGDDGEQKEAELKKAMARYNFYLCVKCDRPYFGGVAACGAVEEGGGAGQAAGMAGAAGGGPGDGGGRDGREDLMCGACSAKASGMAAATCARHGEQYIEFKCRFCCSIATFFCFGHTHFCEKCHQKWVQGASRDPSKLVQKCSCGHKHAPNGTQQTSEACFGCSLCRIVSSEAAPI